MGLRVGGWSYEWVSGWSVCVCVYVEQCVWVSEEAVS